MKAFRFSSPTRQTIRQAVVVLVIIALAIAIPIGTAKAYTGYPTTSIVSVEKDVSVTVQIKNLPPNQTFTVRMGKMGTLGVGGEIVKTFDSGTGGDQKMTFSIPAALKGQAQIAFRMDSTPGGWFAYDFFNNSVSQTAVPTSATTPTKTPTGPTPTKTPTKTPTGPTPTKTAVTPAATKVPGYTGIPTIKIIAVVKDDTVTIKTDNYPANETFTVRMGAFGTRAIGGVVVGTTESGKGGAFEATYKIPAEQKGNLLIAIRLDSTHGYYSYNWFWNNNAP